MKFYLKPIDKTIATAFLKANPDLAGMSLCDEFLQGFDRGEDYDPGDCLFTGVYDSSTDEMVCFGQASLFTDTTISCHQFLRIDYHNTGAMRKIHDLYMSYMHETYPAIKKVMILSPEPCSHVHEAIEHLGYVKEGCLTNAMTWRQHTVDLFIYCKDLR